MCYSLVGITPTLLRALENSFGNIWSYKTEFGWATLSFAKGPYRRCMRLFQCMVQSLPREHSPLASGQVVQNYFRYVADLVNGCGKGTLEHMQ